VTPIGRWLLRAAALRPRHPALVVGGCEISYAALEARARALALRLRAAGVGKGDRVALFTARTGRAVAWIHAVDAAGAILVPIGPRATAGEVRARLEDAGPRLLLCDEDLEAMGREAAASCGVSVATARAIAALDPAPGEPVEVHPADADHALVFTSGTTGRAKGVRLRYANHLASARASALRTGGSPDDRWLLCMPVHHVGGLAIALRAAIAGTTVVVHDAFDADAVACAFVEGSVTRASLVPTMLVRVLDALGPARAAQSLRCVLIGGGPAPAALLARARAAGIPVAPTYGLSEAASQVATLAPSQQAAGDGTVGRPLDGVEVRILGEDGRERPRGAEGEIVVRGPQVMVGYWRNPEATARALREGWLHTGDVGRLDAGGRLAVLDRRSDLIVTGGENVAPAEVEAVLREHPQIADAAVVGMPDAEWGQRVCAFVVARGIGQPAPEALVAFCRERLAGFKLPRRVEWLGELPRTASGKVRRHALRALVTPGGRSG